MSRNFRRRVAKVKQRIAMLRGRTDAESMEEFDPVRKQCSGMLVQNEIYWKQRPKQFWLFEGDANTRYFHASTTVGQKKNRITRLRDGGGVSLESKGALKKMMTKYFIKLFTLKGSD